jgi:hypothetical protein
MEFQIKVDRPNWKAIENQVVKEANEEVRRRITRALVAFRCPDHGKPVRFVRAQGTLPDGNEDLGRLEGCCDKAVELAEKRVDHALESEC